MFKIKGYLKKFWYLILACICLLFVQAQTELTLPDYMSDIVSVGIQAGGFASPVSDVLTEETYQHLLLFVDQKDQKTVKKDYKKVSKVNQDIIDTFPKAKGKTVYQLKDLSSDEESELEDILMKPMLIITSLDSMDTSSKEYQEKFGQLPPNMSVYDAISFMDESQKSKMFEDMDTRIDTMGESTLKIAAGNGVKAEYKKLGAEIVEVSLPHTEYAVITYYIIAPAEASANLARFDGVRYGYRNVDATSAPEMTTMSRTEGFGQEVRRRIMLGTYVLSSGYYDAYYNKAMQVRTLIRRDFEAAFEKCDVLLTPTSPVPAYGINDEMDPLTMYMLDVTTIPVNMAGLPGISIPCGFADDGMPIGMQLIGKVLDEATILRAAYTFEQATEYHKVFAPLGGNK